MFSYGCLKWFSYGFKFVLFSIFIFRITIDSTIEDYREPSYLAPESGNTRTFTRTARNCMIVATAIIFISALLIISISQRGLVYAYAIDFIVSIALAGVMLNQDDFDKLNKDGLDFIIVYLLFGFALTEVITGYMAWKKANKNRYETVIGYSNHGMIGVQTPVRRASAAIASDPTSRIIAVQTPEGVKIVGIEEQHAVLEDGRGGILIVKNTNAASLGANQRRDVSLGDIEQVQFFYHEIKET